MKKTTLTYGIILALAALALQWLDYRHSVRMFSTELYIILIGVGFTGLGAWLGHRLTRRRSVAPFSRNDKALQSLGISDREYEVLESLAEGLSNAEIAERLFVSPNTVKTHISRVYEKLDVSRRTQAVQKARSLSLIP